MGLNVELLRGNIFINECSWMRMLRWIRENKRKYRIQIGEICLKIGVTPIDDKIEMVWSCAKDWRRVIYTTMRKSVVSSWENERVIGWPRMTLIELVKINTFKEVAESMLLNRTEWPRIIHAADYH